jgi:hypothetical protein
MALVKSLRKDKDLHTNNYITFETKMLLLPINESRKAEEI